MEKTLVIDNGSYSVKMGLCGAASPIALPNCIARTKDKKLYISDQIDSIRDISQVQIRRSHEDGQLTSWDLQKAVWDIGFDRLSLGSGPFDDYSLCLTETIYQLPQLSKATDQIIFEEYEFNKYYKTPAAALVPWNVEMNQGLISGAGVGTQKRSTDRPYSDFQLVVDSGFNCTWIVPMIQGLVYWPAVKKLDIGGRTLNGLLREMISFRYYDVTEETILVNNIKQSSCFVAEDYNQTISKITEARQGKVHQDLVMQYVLPDFKTTMTGYALDPASDVDTSELQILKLYDERITVPEMMFHPEIAQLDNRAGLVQCIIAAIKACPVLVQPLLAANVVLIGGNFKIPGFAKRLSRELELDLPQDWDIRVAIDQDKVAEYAWHSGCAFVDAGGFDKVAISKQDYYEHGAGILNKFKPPPQPASAAQ